MACVGRLSGWLDARVWSCCACAPTSAQPVGRCQSRLDNYNGGIGRSAMPVRQLHRGSSHIPSCCESHSAEVRSGLMHRWPRRRSSCASPRDKAPDRLLQLAAQRAGHALCMRAQVHSKHQIACWSSLGRPCTPALPCLGLPLPCCPPWPWPRLMVLISRLSPCLRSRAAAGKHCHH